MYVFMLKDTCDLWSSFIILYYIMLKNKKEICEYKRF